MIYLFYNILVAIIFHFRMEKYYQLSIKDNRILHNASTDKGASGSPIIRRSENNYIIGLHYDGYKDKLFNIGTPFDSILNDIKNKLMNLIVYIMVKKLNYYMILI